MTAEMNWDTLLSSISKSQNDKYGVIPPCKLSKVVKLMEAKNRAVIFFLSRIRGGNKMETY